MTTAHFPTSTTSATTIVSMSDGDTTDVAAGVSLLCTGSIAILDFGSGNVEVDGTVSGTSGISIDGTVGEISNVIIGTTGSVTGWDATFGLDVLSGTHEITNRGQISCLGSSGSGVLTGGPGQLLNYGSISGNWGIEDEDGTAGDATTVDNYGSVSGTQYGYFNDGFGADVVTFYNFGDLTGGSESFIVESGSSVVHLVNSGKMVADIFLSNTGGDRIANRGLIEGNVHLGNGTNVFNGVGGTIDGTITGGSGVDTIRLGNDGETVNGGAGHDHIYCGTGADVFAFNSLVGANSDTVYGFNVANDTLQLDHTVYTALTPGVTPAFSISSTPTSASDHLFYNSTTGWVYYDADGTGSQASHPFVNIGVGLHPTAHNFTVV